MKNLFELKAARRATIRKNLFEQNWTDGQSGTAILFTVRNEDGRSPWTVIEDVLFEHNIIRDTEGVFSISGYDDQSRWAGRRGSPCVRIWRWPAATFCSPAARLVP